MGRALQKMTREDVALALQMRAAGDSYRKIAAHFGVSHVNIKEHIDRAATNSIPTNVLVRQLKPNVKESKHNVKESKHNTEPPPYRGKHTTPPPHQPKKKFSTLPAGMAPAEWKYFLARMYEGHGDTENGGTWNRIQRTAYIVLSLDAGVPEKTICDKAGMGCLDWFKEEFHKGEKQMWGKVIQSIMQDRFATGQPELGVASSPTGESWEHQNNRERLEILEKQHAIALHNPLAHGRNGVVTESPELVKLRYWSQTQMTHSLPAPETALAIRNEGLDTALATYGNTELTMTTPTGMKALASLSDFLSPDAAAPVRDRSCIVKADGWEVPDVDLTTNPNADTTDWAAKDREMKELAKNRPALTLEQEAAKFRALIDKQQAGLAAEHMAQRDAEIAERAAKIVYKNPLT